MFSVFLGIYECVHVYLKQCIKKYVTRYSSSKVVSKQTISVPSGMIPISLALILPFKKGSKAAGISGRVTSKASVPGA